jgi:manganese/zinc/iron transport system permease protein
MPITEVIDFLLDYTNRNVLIGTTLLGLITGIVGNFSVIKKQSLIGDTMSHSALPGVALAFIILEAKNLPLLVVGAGMFCLIGAYSVFHLTKKSKLADDTALGIVMSGMFAIGIVLLSIISKEGRIAQAGIDTYIFGQAATLIETDVIIFSIFSILILLTVILNYKEIKTYLFDIDFSKVAGFNTRAIEALVILTTVLVIVLSIEIIGVILMIALLVMPSVIARHWTDKFAQLLIFSGFIGAVSSATGAFLSLVYEGVPTGPSIILIMSLILGVSIFKSKIISAKPRIPPNPPYEGGNKEFGKTSSSL